MPQIKATAGLILRLSPSLDSCMQRYRVLVVGGYGFFGRRLVERLARQPGLHVIVAGRDASAANTLVRTLQPTSAAQLQGACFDVMAPDFGRALVDLRPHVVVHASGPFQGQDYRVAEACIRAGTHYIDLGDGRAFVAGIDILNEAASAAGVLVTSGASSVPALSSAAADSLARGMKEVQTIDIGISPGNRTERGLSTMKGVLSYCGQPIPRGDGKFDVGWGRTYRHTYPAPVGVRLLSPCDVPDRTLLPLRYPGTPEVRFGAGLELEVLHRGMNVMAAMARFGLVRNWMTYARGLKRMADMFKNWGSDAGAMHVTVAGIDIQEQPVRRTWQLLATDGDGPYVPTLAAAALVRKLAAGDLRFACARACMGLLDLDDFASECSDLHITAKTTDE